MLRALRRLLLPFLPVAVAGFVAVAAPGSLPDAGTMTLAAWLVAALLVLDLSRRVRHAGTGWTAGLLVLLVEAAARRPPASDLDLASLALVLVGLDLALVAVLRGPPLFSLAGLGGFVVLGAQASTLAWLAAGELPSLRSWLAERLQRPLFPALEIPDGLPPQLVLAVLLVAATVVTGAALVRRRGLDGAQLAVLVAVVAAAWQLERGAAPQAVALLCGGLAALAAGVVEDVFSFAFEDPLTGLPGRRALEASLRELGRRYAVAMVDLDRFKRLNDRHGHEAGDQVLRMVATRLAAVGGGGTAYRYGGEEFTVLFPGKSAEEARPHLEAVRQAIAERRFALRSGRRTAARDRDAKRRGSGGAAGEVKVTISVGLAAADGGRGRPQEIIARADRLLYRAKKAGRNRVVVG